MRLIINHEEDASASHEIGLMCFLFFFCETWSCYDDRDLGSSHCVWEISAGLMSAVSIIFFFDRAEPCLGFTSLPRVISLLYVLLWKEQHQQNCPNIFWRSHHNIVCFTSEHPLTISRFWQKSQRIICVCCLMKSVLNFSSSKL